MEDLKESFEVLNKTLDEKELEGNEYYLFKDEQLRETFKDFDNKKLFKLMFLKEMNEIDIEDKIVMIYNIKKYDKKELKKANKKMSLVEGEKQENDINDFKTVIFETIKSIVLKGLDIAKELIKNQFDIFFAQAAGALGEFLKENGLKLLEIIIDKIRSGTPVEDVKIKIDGKKMALIDILPEEDCQKIDKLAKDVDDIYDKTYKDIDERVYEAKNGQEVKPFDDIVKSNEISQDEKQQNNTCCIIL